MTGVISNLAATKASSTYRANGTDYRRQRHAETNEASSDLYRYYIDANSWKVSKFNPLMPSVLFREKLK